jgi:hypothetical protein
VERLIVVGLLGGFQRRHADDAESDRRAEHVYLSHARVEEGAGRDKLRAHDQLWGYEHGKVRHLHHRALLVRSAQGELGTRAGRPRVVRSRQRARYAPGPRDALCPLVVLRPARAHHHNARAGRVDRTRAERDRDSPGRCSGARVHGGRRAHLREHSHESAAGSSQGRVFACGGGRRAETELPVHRAGGVRPVKCADHGAHLYEYDRRDKLADRERAPPRHAQLLRGVEHGPRRSTRSSP